MSSASDYNSMPYLVNRLLQIHIHQFTRSQAANTVMLMIDATAAKCKSAIKIFTRGDERSQRAKIVKPNRQRYTNKQQKHWHLKYGTHKTLYNLNRFVQFHIFKKVCSWHRLECSAKLFGWWGRGAHMCHMHGIVPSVIWQFGDEVLPIWGKKIKYKCFL